MNSLPVGKNDFLDRADQCEERKLVAFQVAIGTALVGVVAAMALTILGALFAAWAVYAGVGFFAATALVALGAGGVSIYYDCKEDYLREKGAAQEKQQPVEQSSVEEEELPLSTLLAPKPNGANSAIKEQFDSLREHHFVYS